MSFKDKIVTLAVVVGGVQAYSMYSGDQVPKTAASERTQISEKRQSKRLNNFRCDGRQHCSQMTSREEAVFFTRNCPNTKMDGDNDGIPCERDSRW